VTARLEAAVRGNPWLAAILDRFDAIALPDAWLVAGAIAQTIWNQAARRAPEAGIKDVDLVYFDAADLSAEAEAAHERRLRDAFADLPVALDVKNEARVHLWYERKFGKPIAPYRSTADAIATFPTTATSVGVRIHRDRFETCAPFGLDDLFGLVVRANRRQIDEPAYATKVARWRPIWPALTVLPWEAGTAPPFPLSGPLGGRGSG